MISGRSEEIRVEKLYAAESQLATAIELFFLEYNPISIHTLVSASLAILHDHIPHQDRGDTELVFHYDTIYIKDEARKFWAKKVREPANFFKHADRDLKDDKRDIIFRPMLTDLMILEALICLQKIRGGDMNWRPEFRIYYVWYFLKYPQHLKKDAKPFGEMELNEDPEAMHIFASALEIMKK